VRESTVAQLRALAVEAARDVVRQQNLRELTARAARRAVQAEFANRPPAEPDPDVILEFAAPVARATVYEAIDELRDSAVKAAVEATTAAVDGAVDTAVTAAVEAAEKACAEFMPTPVHVTLSSGEHVEVAGETHEVLPEVLLALSARCHVLLVGPAGTGKSMLAKHCAEALGLELQAISLGPTTPMSKVFGYFDAHGEYHDTPFRRAFEHGGVMLLDELDNGHPGLLAELNQALALGVCAFADRMVTAHENFRLVATGNTYGTGGDRNFVGRQALDAATLDRFVVVDVPIDERLEERLAMALAPKRKREVRQLLTEVRRLREVAESKRLPVMFSPRACLDGAKLLAAGATYDQVLRWRVVRGLSAAHRGALGLS
jgi:cobaltochelatase CobS